MVKVWYYKSDKSFSKSEFDRYLTLIPSSLHGHINKYRFAIDRQARLIGRLLLRKAVVESGHDPSILETLTYDKKKPCIPTWDNFNLSYSNNIVALAHSDQDQIGIDVEYMEINEDYLSLREIFNEQELKLLDGSNNSLSVFYMLWVKKEAVLKASGDGLINDLHKINCANNSLWYKNEKWFFRKVEIGPKYTSYLASTDSGQEMEVTEISKELL